MMPPVTFTDEPMPSRSVDSALLAAYLHNSNDVIFLKLVRSAEDFYDASKEFHPAMTHQIYDEEQIFGYKEVAVKLYFAATSLKIYLNVKTGGSIKSKRSLCFSSEVQNVEKPLKDILPTSNVFTNADEFLSQLEDEKKLKPYGHQIHSFSKEEKTFEIYHADVVNCPGFKDFHDRLQTFIMFFIDGASYIDADDDKWHYFVLYEKFKADGDGTWRYGVVGYSTAYEYYAYPDKTRPRISQFLILPPWQRMGCGAELLRSVYRYYQGVPAVLDITVEDPSDEFLMLRHYVDAAMCRTLPSFQANKLRCGFSKEMVREANQKYKLNAKQVRRVYEILRIGATNLHDDNDLKKYRLDVKKRFFAGNKEGTRALKFANNLAHNDVKELMQAACNPDVMRQSLKEAFDSQFPIYLQIWEKVDKSS